MASTELNKVSWADDDSCYYGKLDMPLNEWVQIYGMVNDTSYNTLYARYTGKCTYDPEACEYYYRFDLEYYDEIISIELKSSNFRRMVEEDDDYDCYLEYFEDDLKVFEGDLDVFEGDLEVFEGDEPEDNLKGAFENMIPGQTVIIHSLKSNQYNDLPATYTGKCIFDENEHYYVFSLKFQNSTILIELKASNFKLGDDFTNGLTDGLDVNDEFLVLNECKRTSIFAQTPMKDRKPIQIVVPGSREVITGKYHPNNLPSC